MALVQTISESQDLPRLQRSKGRGRLHVSALDGQSRIKELFQEGSAKIRVPRLPQSGIDAVLINTSGGLTGGDQVDWSFDVAQDAELTLTTQACEKVYRSADGVARVSTQINVGERAFGAWLPQETILFDRAGLARSLTVDLAKDAEFLAVEPVILGRAGMGEVVELASLSDRWRIRQDDHLIHAEDLRLSGRFENLRSRKAGLGEVSAFATVFYTGPRVELLSARAQAHADNYEVCVSSWEGKLVVRIMCCNGQQMRRKLIPILNDLHRGTLPRIWHS